MSQPRTPIQDMTKVQLIELLVKVNRRQKGLTSKFTSVRTAFKFEHGLLADLLATAAEAPEAARILELLEQSQATPDGTEPSTTTVAAEFGGIKATLVARLTREDQLGAQLETAENKRKATVLKMRELVQKVRQVQTVAMADRQKVTVAEERVALLTEGHAAALEASAASTAQLEATVQSLRERSAVDEEGSAAEAVALRAELVANERLVAELKDAADALRSRAGDEASAATAALAALRAEYDSSSAACDASAAAVTELERSAALEESAAAALRAELEASRALAAELEASVASLSSTTSNESSAAAAALATLRDELSTAHGSVAALESSQTTLRGEARSEAEAASKLSSVAATAESNSAALEEMEAARAESARSTSALEEELTVSEKKRQMAMAKMRDLVQKVRHVQKVALGDRELLKNSEEALALQNESHAEAMEASAASTATLEAALSSLRESASASSEEEGAALAALRTELVANEQLIVELKNAAAALENRVGDEVSAANSALAELRTEYDMKSAACDANESAVAKLESSAAHEESATAALRAEYDSSCSTRDASAAAVTELERSAAQEESAAAALRAELKASRTLAAELEASVAILNSTTSEESSAAAAALATLRDELSTARVSVAALESAQSDLSAGLNGEAASAASAMAKMNAAAASAELSAAALARVETANVESEHAIVALREQLEVSTLKRQATKEKMSDLVEKVRVVQEVALEERASLKAAEEQLRVLGDEHTAAVASAAAAQSALEASAEASNEFSVEATTRIAAEKASHETEVANRDALLHAKEAELELALTSQREALAKIDELQRECDTALVARRDLEARAQLSRTAVEGPCFNFLLSLSLLSSLFPLPPPPPHTHNTFR